ncbi:MAG: hypothetical protein E6R12_07220 [Sphingomonadales bacterium]|nr:MAG: hypothetical protein E6R12_07220 [Sphingomonadales bacterium]
MADEIQDADVRVTPSFHPQTIQSLDVYDDDTSTILAGTVSAFTEAYIAVGRVHDASAASKTNPAWNEAAALIHTADFADKLTLQLAKRFDSATAGLTRVIEGLESELSQPIEGQGVGAMAGEIRAFVRGMSDGERMGFILDAIDDTTLETDAVIEKLRTIHIGIIDDLLTRGLANDGTPREPSTLAETEVGLRPGTWTVANLGRFVVGAEYGTNLSLGDSSSGIPVLRMNNIQDGEFDLSDLKYAPAHSVERIRVQRNDVLFNRTNSWEHVGKTAIWRHNEPGPAFASYLVRLHCGEELLPEFLHLWLNWAPVQRAIRRFATPGVQQVNINPTNLRRALIAVPDTLDEQRAIIERVNGVSAAIEVHRRERAKLVSLREGLRDDLLSGRKPVAAIREVAE